jgi:hypothetical protein
MPVLTRDQLDRFVREGYVVVPDVVSEHLLAAADAEIDDVVASDPPSPGKVGAHAYFLPPARLPAAAAALSASGALAVAESLVAPRSVARVRADPRLRGRVAFHVATAVGGLLAGAWAATRQ